MRRPAHQKKKPSRHDQIALAVGLALLAFIGSHQATATLSQQGLSMQGLSMQGLSMQGLSMQGLSMQGLSMQGLSMQGLSMQGLSMQGLSMQGLSMQGLSMQGLSMQGLSMQGLSMQGLSMQGLSMQGLSMQGLSMQGIDRLRSFPAMLEFRGIARADVQLPGVNVQGLQSGAPLPYVQVANPMTGVRLQASYNDTSHGSFIYVPGVPELKGTLWNMVVADCAGQGGIPLYVADVQKDTATNTSKYPSNDDVYLYTVYYRQPATGQWVSLCPVDGSLRARPRMAVPLDPTGSQRGLSRKVHVRLHRLRRRREMRAQLGLQALEDGHTRTVWTAPASPTSRSTSPRSTTRA